MSSTLVREAPVAHGHWELHLPQGGVIALGGGRPACVMGILNVTDDSFSDGGLYRNPDAAVARAEQMAGEGADIIDVGGESTRPGSDPVPPEEQVARVVPVISRLATRLNVPISIDTAYAEVARQALNAGAQIVNDVTALRGDDGMGSVVAETGAPVILMHMLGTPKDMQAAPAYADVVHDVMMFLSERIDAAVAYGIKKEQVVVDPGVGFGKTLEHNLDLMARLAEFESLGRPVLVGTSRKSMIGAILDAPSDERLFGSLATVAVAIERGAVMARVHDVKATVDLVKVLAAIQGRVAT